MLETTWTLIIIYFKILLNNEDNDTESWGALKFYWSKIGNKPLSIKIRISGASGPEFLRNNVFYNKAAYFYLQTSWEEKTIYALKRPYI